MKNNTLIAIIAVVILGLGAWALFSMDRDGSSKKIDGDAVAIVNGESVSREDYESLELQIAMSQGLDITSLDAESKSGIQAQTLDALISQVLLKQASSESGVTVSDEDVDAEMEIIRGRFENQEMFEDALQSGGLSEEDLRAQIADELSIAYYLEEELNLESVIVTEEEVTSAYATMSEGSTDIPPLEEVYEQAESLVIQQKQQDLITDLVERLREDADIEILI